MVLRTNLTDEVAANTHQQSNNQQSDDGGRGVTVAVDKRHPMTNHGIDETEDQQTLDKPHVSNFRFTCQYTDDSPHEE